MRKIVLFVILSMTTFIGKAQELTAVFIANPEMCEELGSIEISATGGDGNYVYAITQTGNTVTATDFSPNHFFFNVQAGSYDCYVRDNSGQAGFSEYFVTVQIDMIPELSSIITTEAPLCSGGNSRITIESFGGIPPYEYSIDQGLSWQVSNVFDNLFEGETFFVLTRDVYSCETASNNYTIPFVPAINAVANLTEPLTCISQAEITFEPATGGLPPYQYGIDGVYSEELVKTVFDEGTYQLSVLDANGCIQSLDMVIAQDYPSFNAFPIDISCTGANDGSIQIDNIAGTPPFRVDLYDVSANLPLDTAVIGSTNYNFTNLTSAEYRVVVTDDFGCLYESDIIISEPAPILSVVTYTSSAIAIQVTGGTPPYEYSIDDGTTYQIANVFDNLENGTYQIIIRDSNNCMEISDEVVIENLAPVAEDDAATTIVDTPVIVDVFDNDQNIPTDGSITISDALNGTVTINDGGTPNDLSDDAVTYTPNSGFEGIGTFEYAICDVTFNYCDTALVTITVQNGNNIDAVPDDYGATPLVAGESDSTTSVLLNDTFNGSPVAVDAVGIPIDISLVGTDVPAGLTFNGNGTITADAGAQEGTYEITYMICEIGASPTNCDVATAFTRVVEEADVINAVDIDFTGVPLEVGESTPDVTLNDTFNGIRVVLGTDLREVTINVDPNNTNPSGLTLDPATGIIRLDVDIPSGVYVLEYEICENGANPANCDTAKATVVVGQAIVAVDDDFSTTPLAPGESTTNVTFNDTLFGNPIIIGTNEGEVTMTVDPNNTNPIGFIFNSMTGIIEVDDSTSSGIYELEYQICENGASPANCDSAIARLVVWNPIDAVDDDFSTTPLVPGESTTTVIDNDTLNGDPVILGFNPGEVTMTVDPNNTNPSGFIFDPMTGIIEVDGSAPTGIYELEYQICENGASPSNCDTAIATVTVDNFDGLQLTTSVISNIYCAGGDNGEIEALVIGGQPPYRYELTNNVAVTIIEVSSDETSFVFSNLEAGEYQVRVTDGSFNFNVEDVVIITDPDEIVASLSVINPSCNQASDGIINAENVTGGSGVYTYSIDATLNEFQTSPIFTGLTSGTYEVTILDENGCTLTMQVVLTDPEVVTINSLTALPTGNEPSGNIEVGATGGNGNYLYSINGGEFTPSNTFFDLEEGVYDVVASDTNLCTSVSVAITIVKLDVNNKIQEDTSGALVAEFKGATSYQWINVDTGERIPGATDPDYTPTENGSYQVEMTIPEGVSVAAKGFKTVTNEIIVLSPVIVYYNAVLSVDDLEKQFKIYPNPAVNFITIPSEFVTSPYSIYNILGEEVKKGIVQKNTLEIMNLPHGHYYLKIASFNIFPFMKK